MRSGIMSSGNVELHKRTYTHVHCLGKAMSDLFTSSLTHKNVGAYRNNHPIHVLTHISIETTFYAKYIIAWSNIKCVAFMWNQKWIVHNIKLIGLIPMFKRLNYETQWRFLHPLLTSRIVFVSRSLTWPEIRVEIEINISIKYTVSKCMMLIPLRLLNITSWVYIY